MKWFREPTCGDWWMWYLLQVLLTSDLVNAGQNRFLSASSTNPSSLISLPLTSRHEVLRRRLTTMSIQEPVAFRSAGEHFVDIWVGSPPQLRTLSVDTGSSFTAFICNDCQNCGSNRVNPAFQQNQSKSYHRLNCTECSSSSECNNVTNQCQYFVNYTDGSEWLGSESLDFVSFTNFTNLTSLFELDFVCQESLTGNFLKTATDGIMGLGFAAESFWYQIYLAGVTTSPTFSFCSVSTPDLAYASTPNPDGTYPPEGVLTLGGSDPRLHDSNMVFSDTATETFDFYFHASIRQVYLGFSLSEAVPLFSNDTDLLNIPPAGTIVDTGTAVSTFPIAWYQAINQQWINVTGDFFDPFLAFPESDRDKFLPLFPTFYFQLSGDAVANVNLVSNSTPTNHTPGLAFVLDKNNPFDIIIPFPPSHYIMTLGATEGVTYSGPQFNFSNANFTVLGENFISGHDVFFDYTNNHIGWANSNCQASRVQPPTMAPTTIAPSMTPITTAPTRKAIKLPSKKHVVHHPRQPFLPVAVSAPKRPYHHDKDGVIEASHPIGGT